MNAVIWFTAFPLFLRGFFEYVFNVLGQHSMHAVIVRFLRKFCGYQIGIRSSCERMIVATLVQSFLPAHARSVRRCFFIIDFAISAK